LVAALLERSTVRHRSCSLSLVAALGTLVLACGSFGSGADATDTPSGTAPAATVAPAQSTSDDDDAARSGGSSAPSCARLHGGRTCGPHGTDDCCATASQGSVRLAKYMVTAGRMRAFVEAFDGDIAGFVRGLPADRWKPEWTADAALPTDRASADVALGPHGKKSCEQGPFTGHTYWTPRTDSDYSDFSQDALDEKALNCVPWELLQALCISDGGRLASVDELRAAFTNGGTTKFPWGDDAPDSWSAPDPLSRLNIEGAFRTEPHPATFRAREDGLPAEVSFMIAPPGRFPKGDNALGIADAAGNLLEYVGDAPRQFVWKADFERHGRYAALVTGGHIWMDRTVTARPWIWGSAQLGGNAGTADERHGYYAIGGRCAF
jgi:hypothetical protein